MNSLRRKRNRIWFLKWCASIQALDNKWKQGYLIYYTAKINTPTHTLICTHKHAVNTRRRKRTKNKHESRSLGRCHVSYKFPSTTFEDLLKKRVQHFFFLQQYQHNNNNYFTITTTTTTIDGNSKIISKPRL